MANLEKERDSYRESLGFRSHMNKDGNKEGYIWGERERA